MYVTPLSAPEVKHNFSLLKTKFKMFNPDCPDCSTSTCEVSDFTYEINDDSLTIYNPTESLYGLGRSLVIDERDKKYLIENKITLPTPTITQKY